MIVRAAKIGDEQALIDLIQGLATYENEPDSVDNTPERLKADLFEHKYCEALVAEVNSEIVAFTISDKEKSRRVPFPHRHYVRSR